MEDYILVRYGELSLKKSNRKQFINRIQNHIKRSCEPFSNLTFEARGLRFYINLNNTEASSIIEILKQIPGIYSFSVVSRCLSDLNEINLLAKELVEQKLKEGFKTFKIETNRGDKNFPKTSPEITKEVGSFLFKNVLGLKADMYHPDFVLSIDVRQEGTFLFTNTYMGLGGFPAGCLGKVGLMISGGIDSVVAGYLAIKKGMQVEAIHFSSPPYTSDLAVQKVIDLLEVLTSYTEYQNLNLYIVPFSKIQQAIYENVKEDYCITIMRRMMYRITEKLAKRINALAIVNGENVGQVASQTLESMNTIESVVDMCVIRPLATYDKQDIVDLAKKIKTYDISIRPYEDCCTVFVPKHPQIKPRLDLTIKEENKLTFDELIDDAINNVQKITLRKNHHYDYIASHLKDLTQDLKDLF